MLIPLDDARICLDCDIVTDTETCPACGRDQTFPLAVWLVPLQASQTRPWSGGLRLQTGAAARWLMHHAPPRRPARRGHAGPQPARGRWLIVVRRDEQELYEYLRQRFQAMGSVEVVLDRRRSDRRRGGRRVPMPERRQQPRRKPLSAEERTWWRLAGFRVIARADSFRLYETLRAEDGSPAPQPGRIRNSSTSNTKVAPGGMTPPAPRSP